MIEMNDGLRPYEHHYSNYMVIMLLSTKKIIIKFQNVLEKCKNRTNLVPIFLEWRLYMAALAEIMSNKNGIFHENTKPQNAIREATCICDKGLKIHYLLNYCMQPYSEMNAFLNHIFVKYHEQYTNATWNTSINHYILYFIVSWFGKQSYQSKYHHILVNNKASNFSLLQKMWPTKRYHNQSSNILDLELPKNLYFKYGK